MFSPARKGQRSTSGLQGLCANTKGRPPQQRRQQKQARRIELRPFQAVHFPANINHVPNQSNAENGCVCYEGSNHPASGLWRNIRFPALPLLTIPKALHEGYQGNPVPWLRRCALCEKARLSKSTPYSRDEVSEEIVEFVCEVCHSLIATL
jgi:hypothetical protein